MQDDLSRPVRILLVDDSSEFLDSASRFLSRQPHLQIAGLARSGLQAIELAKQCSPDLVLMDLAMPGMNGVEASARIKAQPDPPRIIIVSFHLTSEYRASILASGADDMMSKGDFVQGILPAIAKQFPSCRSHEKVLV